MIDSSTKVEIQHVTRHCGNAVLGAVPYSEVYLMDCVAGLRHYPDNYFDLAVVDPPYGIGVSEMNIGARRTKNKACDGKGWDNSIPTDNYWDELYRVSKHQIVWGANYFNCFNGKNGAIIWHKNNPLPTSSDCEIASYSKHAKVAIYNKTWTNYVNDKATNHPTEKPISLYDWIFKNYAKAGEIILDTHLGSGSSRIAADKAGLNFVGFEIDEEYFNAANKRFDNFKSQTRLF
jgi:site-specific DNA-methyltransferase (adenine-specific)